ncbi:MAG: glycosyltransferase [Planctomycetaceae bacterium]|nr:glycosyltransferase [Planctomycetaceae bacterium]
MSTQRSHRVLFVAYQFPPVGGVGVHRVTKFVKYLPEFGWQSSVLTVSNPSVPLHDDSLLRDIPVGTIIRRAKTLEPGYALKSAVSGANGGRQSQWSPKKLIKGLARKAANTVLQPDSQILWHRHAYREGIKLLTDTPHDAIIATGPPFSSLLLGARLSRQTGLPLILDYRDEWDISNAYWENKGQGPLSNWIQKRLQQRAVKQADVVLATTPSSAAAVGQVARQANNLVRQHYIYNGFDPDDYAGQGTASKQDYGAGTSRFRLSFIGTLWNLNSVAPVVEALQKLSQKNPQLGAEIELLVAGRRTDEQNALLDGLAETPVALTRLPFVSHQEAVELMQSADALLMLNSDLPKAQRIINAKVFEYMAAQRPMFVVAPQGDVWDIVRDLPGTVLCTPGETDGIAEQLAIQVEQHRLGVRYEESLWDIDRFHRRSLTGELAQLLEETVTQANLEQTLSQLTSQSRKDAPKTQPGISESPGGEK